MSNLPAKPAIVGFERAAPTAPEGYDVRKDILRRGQTNRTSGPLVQIVALVNDSRVPRTGALQAAQRLHRTSGQ